MSKTLNLPECAALLNVARSTALELAGKGELPGAKIGRCWVFIEDDVIAYMREVADLQGQQRRDEQAQIEARLLAPFVQPRATVQQPPPESMCLQPVRRKRGRPRTN